MLWPLARVVSADARGMGVLKEMGLTAHELVDGDRRIPFKLAMFGLQRSIEVFEDPLLGLKAGAVNDPTMFDVLEYAAASRESFGDALQVVVRYMHVMSEGAETWLSTEGELSYWNYAPVVPHPDASNDMVVASCVVFSRRICAAYVPPVEVWVTHARPAYAAAYEEYLQAPVRFGASHNAIVRRREFLAAPMISPNAELSLAFQDRVAALAKGLGQLPSVTRRVREELAAQFASGSVEMVETARKLGMSVATLRRKLEDEGASFSAILDQMRRDAALNHLRKPAASVSDIAFMLGFSDVRAFARAFKRWTGQAPSEFRDQSKHV